MDSASDSSEQERRQELLLSEYDHALEIGKHSDAVFHEVAAIAWGANTLLLGFILEVSCDSPNQALVILAAVVGLFVTAYVPIVMYLTKIGQKVAYEACREIENELQLPHRINNKIYERYPRNSGQVITSIITIIFVVVWVLVIVHADNCRCSFNKPGGLADVSQRTGTLLESNHQMYIPPETWHRINDVATIGLTIVIAVAAWCQWKVATRILKLEETIERRRTEARLFLRVKHVISANQQLARLEIANLSQTGVWLEKATVHVAVPPGSPNRGHALMLETKLCCCEEQGVNLNDELRIASGLEIGSANSRMIAWVDVEFWANGSYHTESSNRYSIDIGPFHVLGVKPA